MRPQLFLFCMGILCYFQDAFAQTQWIRLDNEKTIIPEYILCSEAGDKYVSVSGRKAILGKKAGETKWTNLMENNPEIRYFMFWDSKTLFFDHSQNLRLYYRTDYFDALFNFQKDRFVLDTSSVNQIDHNFQYEIIYDTLGKSYYFKDNQLFSFLTAYGQTQKIFDKREKIVKAIMISPSENYVLTQRTSDSLRLYKLNSSDFKTQLLTELHNPAGQHQFAQLTKSGNLFIINGEGLFRFSTQLQQTEKLVIDNALPTPYHPDALYLSKKGELIVKIDSLFYYSSNEGTNWIMLYSMSKDFPTLSDIIQMEIIDSTNALAIVNEDCQASCLELDALNFGWRDLMSGYSFVHRGIHFVSSLGKIYSSKPGCVVEESMDEAQTWTTVEIFGNKISQMLGGATNKVFAVAEGGAHLYESIDDGNQWIENREIQMNNPGIVFMNLRSLAPGITLLMGAFKDPVSGQIIKYVPILNDGTNWKVLSSAQEKYFNLEVKFDPFNKLIYALDNTFTNPQFYASDISGAAFILQDKLNLFSKIYSYTINDNGYLFVSGVKNGVLDLYVSADQKKFESVGNGKYVDLLFNEMYRYNNGIIVGVDVILNVYFSKDGGFSWEAMSDGLGLNQKEIKLVGGICINGLNTAFVSVSYDGIYKTAQVIASNNQFSLKSGHFSVIPNPLSSTFEIQGDALNFIKTTQFYVYTMDGRLVTQFSAETHNQYFNFPANLPEGMYYILLRDENYKEYYTTIIKK